MPTAIKNRKIHLAIVGCGRVAKHHFAAVRECSDDLELIAACDVNPEAAERHANEFQVAKHRTLEQLLSDSKPDVVALCTPSGLHASQTILSAQHGVDVITEKPMATRWRDGLDMVRACDQASVRLFVVKQNRHNPTLRLLKRAIDEKRFGRIHAVHVNVFWTRPQEYYDQSDWRGTWEFDGGALMNQASHYVDLLDWLIGPVKKVQAMTSTYLNIEVEDTGVMNLQWRNGAIGSLSVTMLTYPKNLEASITVLGEKGTARVGGVAANEIQHWDFSETSDGDKEAMQTNYQPDSVYGFGHLPYYKDVIGTLREGGKPEVSGREGLRALELLIAAYMSARDGGTQSLPLEY